MSQETGRKGAYFSVAVHLNLGSLGKGPVAVSNLYD